jgi:hypothetical protein
MNFLYTILIFLTMSLSFLGISTQVTNEYWYDAMITLTVITGLATIITTLTMLFQNMYLNSAIIKHLNRITQYGKVVAKSYEELELYKREFETVLTEMYPKYEKDIFSNMATSDARSLETLLVKYPELKFDGVLTSYVDGIKKKLNRISDYEYSIIEEHRHIDDINTSYWKLRRKDVSEVIK